MDSAEYLLYQTEQTALTKAKLAVDRLASDGTRMLPNDRAHLLALARQGLACFERLMDCGAIVCHECETYHARGDVRCGN